MLNGGAWQERMKMEAKETEIIEINSARNGFFMAKR
jgi:hypothetical protein